MCKLVLNSHALLCYSYPQTCRRAFPWLSKVLSEDDTDFSYPLEVQVAPVQTSLSKVDFFNSLPEPANTDEAMPSLSSDQKIVSWLFKITSPHKPKQSAPTQEIDTTASPFEKSRQFLTDRANRPMDDWHTVASISGHSVHDMIASGIDLPLTAAEIDHFRRNHRETDRLVGRDFFTSRNDLPMPLADLYGLYRHRARLDTESTLFVAQATGSTRISRLMADLLTIGGFACGHECIMHASCSYSVPAAFDTADLIDRTCDEATRRMALPIESPAHLLKMTPDEISVLASNIVDRFAMAPSAFLEKANLLSEARQDVHRLPTERHFTTALLEGDLPEGAAWVMRLLAAYRNIFPNWMSRAFDDHPHDIDATDGCA